MAFQTHSTKPRSDILRKVADFITDLMQIHFIIIIIIIIAKVQLIYNVSSSSIVQQSDPITHISLCCTIGSHCPSNPNITVCIQKTPQIPIHPTSSPFPLGNRKSALLGHDLLLFFVCLLFLDRIICSIIQIPQINDTIWYLSFSFCLTSLSMRVSGSIHVAANGIMVVFYMAEQYSIVCIYTTSS